MPKFGKGKPLSGQTREVIHNVAEYFRKHRPASGERTNYVRQASEATGVSLGTVKRVVREGRAAASSGADGAFREPRSKRGTRRKKRLDVDELKLCAIRRKLLELRRRELALSARQLLPILREELQLRCGKEYLRAIMKDIGFRWTRQATSKGQGLKGRSMYIEREEIALWRSQYLCRLREARQEGRAVYYLDETQLRSGHMVTLCWQNSDSPCGKWRRLIVVNANDATSTTAQSASELSTATEPNDSSHWIHQQILGSLVPQSLIIINETSRDQQPLPLDNIRSRTEKPGGTKKQVAEWLRSHGVAFESTLQKSELLELMKREEQTRFISTTDVDLVFQACGHVAIRLPPCHADLSPVRYVWHDLKDYLEPVKATASLAEVTKICEDSFGRYSEEQWRNQCDYVRQLEELYWQDSTVEVESALSDFTTTQNASDSSMSDNDSVSSSSSD